EGFDVIVLNVNLSQSSSSTSAAVTLPDGTPLTLVVEGWNLVVRKGQTSTRFPLPLAEYGVSDRMEVSAPVAMPLSDGARRAVFLPSIFYATNADGDKGQTILN